VRNPFFKLLMIKVKYLQNILMTLLLEVVFFYKIRKEYSKQCREFKQDLISKIDSVQILYMRIYFYICVFYINTQILDFAFYKIWLKNFFSREFKQDLISKIDSLHQNAPNQCWEILNSLRNDYQDSTDSKITPEEWVSHFSNLNKTKQEYTNRVEVIRIFCKYFTFIINSFFHFL
jgi:hypothetical protein